ncbi:MAG: hypothetical protein HOP22_04675 [Nitrospiraceae bacterium]|jgi:hypothetical protein|nr:hypothetical protein [Nitrospiraceae bacterium]
MVAVRRGGAACKERRRGTVRTIRAGIHEVIEYQAIHVPYRRCAYPGSQSDGDLAILGIREAYLGGDELLTLVMEGIVGRPLWGEEAVHMNRKRFAVESNWISW